MKLTRNIAIALAALAFGVVPAVAIGHGKSSSAPGHKKTTTGTTTGTTTTSTNTSTTSSTTTTTSTTTTPTNAFGRYCQGESKKHVAGSKGTPFSNCVVALAHMDKAPKTNPHTACATESKKHVAGMKGTPYSECVAAAAKLKAGS